MCRFVMKTVSGLHQLCLAKVIQTVNETFKERKLVLMFSVTSYGEGVFHLSSGCLVDA